MSEILKLFKDNEEIISLEKLLEGYDSTKILIPTNDLTLGDKITTVYDEKDSEYSEAMFLSIEHKNIYKNLNISAEFSFVSGQEKVDKNFEIIFRASSRWNKSYTADEYYAIGIKDSRFYMALVSFHEEGTNSYSYKRLMNLNIDKQGIISHFISLNADQTKELFLDSYELKYDEKYILWCGIVDNLITLKIANTSKSLDSEYSFVSIFENVDLNQTLEELSNRTANLVDTVAVVEPFSILNDKGFFGFAVPNSHIKLFRYEIVPLDNDIEINRYTDEEYSKQISTEFARFYSTGKQLKFNSSTSLEDIKNEFQEFNKIITNEIIIDRVIKKEDIKKIQANNLIVTKDINFTDKFVDVIFPLAKAHTGSAIKALIDPNETGYYGQIDEYYPLNELTDGISTVYDVPPEFFDKVSLYENGKVGDLLLEVDSDVVYNKFNKVGLQKNPNRFIDYNRLERSYSGRKFYMETDLRGVSKILEMGALGNGQFLFNIDEEFTNPNNSYKAIWDYNLANFIQDALSQYSSVIVTVSGGGDRYYPGDFEFMRTTSLLTQAVTGYSVTIGFAWAAMEKADLEILKTKTFLSPDFNISSSSLDQDIKAMIEKGVPEDYIRAVASYFAGARFSDFTDLILLAKDYTMEFNGALDNFVFLYGANGRYLDYQAFRQLWIRDLDYNSQISTNGILNRKFYVSVKEDEYTVDRENSKITFDSAPDAGKAMVMRVYYENLITLTEDYNKNVSFYTVSSSIKQLYEKSSAEKGVVELLEFYSPRNYKIAESSGVYYVIMPKSINELSGQIYADIEFCGPVVEKDANIKRKVIAPLKKIKELLVNDFETSQYNDYYFYSTTYASLSATPGVSGWNRETDYIDFDNEILTGYWLSGGPEISGGQRINFNYDYPRYYPLPETYGTLGFTDTYFPTLSGSFWDSLLNGDVVGNELIDAYLNVSRWFNVYNSKLSPFYRKVLKDIISVKSSNRIYEDRTPITDADDPFTLGNWFEGFYSGDRTSWIVSSTGDLEFGKYSGHPWGTQNSRKQMIDQIRNTVDDKFSGYELYYVDLTNLLYPQEYRSDTIQDSEFIDRDIYSPSGNGAFLDNPFVDENLKYYVMGETITGSNGDILFTGDSFIGFSDISKEFSSDKTEAYSDLNKSSYTIQNIVRPIVNNVDMFWKFNSSILFENLPADVEVNAEYEYSPTKLVMAQNLPERISQKVNLGVSNGESFQKFPNPDVLYCKNVDNSLVHKIWLDNYSVPDFEVYDLGTSSKVTLASLEPFALSKDVSIDFKISNYYDLQKENLFMDNFSNRREFSWIVLTKDETGYTKESNPYVGYITDCAKLSNECVFHLYPFTTEGLSGYYKVNDTAYSSSLINPVRFGYDIENVVGVVDYRRSNNFELSVDILFDDDIERGLMQTDLIFKGNFSSFKGKQYFTDFYSVTLGLENSNISLIARKTDNLGIVQTQLLAKVIDKYSILKRNQFYTLKVRVVKDAVDVYFNERNQKEIFFFSYNLKTGHDTQNEEIVAAAAVGGLGVSYETPEYFIDGNRIGLRTMSSKVNFSNFKVIALEENNEIFGNVFDVNNYDSTVSILKKKYQITGEVKKLKKTTNGYDYLLIGNILFVRQSGGTFVSHYMYVEDFEIIGEYAYIREKVNNSTSDFIIINVYRDSLILVNNIVVQSKSIINEPIISYLTDTQRIVSEIKEIDGRLFITTATGCNFAKTWDMFNGCVWEEVQSVWYTFG